MDETSSKPGLKPEVEFISESEGDETSFLVVTRNNTGEDGGMEWKAVLDVNSSIHSGLAELESDLGFRITVRDPSVMNVNWDSMRQESPGFVATDHCSVENGPCGHEAPEVETFAFTSNVQSLNNDDLGHPSGP